MYLSVSVLNNSRRIVGYLKLSSYKPDADELLAPPFCFLLIFTIDILHKKILWFPLWFPNDFQENKKVSEALILQDF